MKYDEFGFFNQQLSTMLREGVPLEGALEQLSANMRDGRLRSEIELLQVDLKNGRPLQEALDARRLPDFYVQMIRVGVAGNDLPGILLMLADYYQRVDATWTRLKGLLVYPMIVLTVSFMLSCFLTFVAMHFIHSDFLAVMGIQQPPVIMVNLWAPPLFIGMLLVTATIILFVPAFRRNLRWRIPAFKEAKLAQVGSAMGLMLKNGSNLGDALDVVQQMEHGTVASRELAQWHQQLAQGRGQFSEMAAPGVAFPPLFLWMVSNAGEDLAAGFRRAGEIYHARAVHRIDMFLFAALPLSVLALGAMIICQVAPLVRGFIVMLNQLGN